MGNSWAYPVLRSAELSRVYESAQRLLALAEPGSLVDVTAYTRTHQGLSRYLPVIPSGYLRFDVPAHLAARTREVLALSPGPEKELHDRGDGRLLAMPSFTPDVVAALGRLPDLPVEVTLEDQPLGSVEERFLSVVGQDKGRIFWWLEGWSAVPELGLGPEWNRAHLQVGIHCADTEETVPAPDHTLWVHVHPSEEHRARWLAESVGLNIIGPGESGP